jgi:hypothetical protein
VLTTTHRVIGKLNDLNMLREHCWFYCYTLTTAGCYLLFFVFATRNSETTKDALAAARRAHDMLGMLAQKTPAARICYTSLGEILLSGIVLED